MFTCSRLIYSWIVTIFWNIHFQAVRGGLQQWLAKTAQQSSWWAVACLETRYLCCRNSCLRSSVIFFIAVSCDCAESISLASAAACAIPLEVSSPCVFQGMVQHCSSCMDNSRVCVVYWLQQMLHPEKLGMHHTTFESKSTKIWNDSACTDECRPGFGLWECGNSYIMTAASIFKHTWCNITHFLPALAYLSVHAKRHGMTCHRSYHSSRQEVQFAAACFLTWFRRDKHTLQVLDLHKGYMYDAAKQGKVGLACRFGMWWTLQGDWRHQAVDLCKHQRFHKYSQISGLCINDGRWKMPLYLDYLTISQIL